MCHALCKRWRNISAKYFDPCQPVQSAQADPGPKLFAFGTFFFALTSVLQYSGGFFTKQILWIHDNDYSLSIIHHKNALRPLIPKRGPEIIFIHFL